MREQRYKYQRDTDDRHKGLSKVLSVFSYLLFVFTIGCSALLLLSYFAPYINPNKVVFLSFLGISAPILYISNTILMLYWVLRWKVFAFVPMTVLILGIGNVSLFFRPTVGKAYEEVKSKSAITFMSYNVMGFINTSGGGKPTSNMEKVLDFVDTFSPDILCMQEYQTTNNIRQSRIEEKLDKLPYKAINYRLKDSNGGWGLAIYSKYPIIKSDFINYENSTNSSVWADIVVAKDTIRVVNNHLQTTSISSSDREFIMLELAQNAKDDKRKRVRSILSKLSQNYKIRAMQVDSIAPIIHDSPYKVVVCGDFNDTPVSYCYKRMRGDLLDAFVEKGRGMTNTYRGLFNLFRIDYILHSKSIEALNYSTTPSKLSDHNPVVVDIRINKE